MGILESFALILQTFQASRAWGTPPSRVLSCAFPSPVGALPPLTAAAVSVPVLREDRRESTANTLPSRRVATNLQRERRVLNSGPCLVSDCHRLSTPKKVSHVLVSSVVLSRSVVSDSATPWTVQPARLLCSWDFSGKNTGVGGHFLFQGDLLAMYSTY